MILTRSAYINNEKTEMLADGLTSQEINGFNFDNEYYNLLVNYVKQGNKISNEVYKDLPEGQQYHFNKHYNFNNDKIINSDYEQELKEVKKLNDDKFNKYLQEKETEQKEQELRDLKVKQRVIKELTEELEILQGRLFDYNELSEIGKRNIPRYEHEQKQEKVKTKIKELKNKLNQLAG